MFFHNCLAPLFLYLVARSVFGDFKAIMPFVHNRIPNSNRDFMAGVFIVVGIFVHGFVEGRCVCGVF